MFVSSSTKKIKFTDSMLEGRRKLIQTSPLSPPTPIPTRVSQLLPLHPAWPYRTSRAASYRDAIIHSGSLMSLKFFLSFLLSFSGKEAASGTSSLWDAAVCSWERGSRGSHPWLGRQVTWVMPAYCQPPRLLLVCIWPDVLNSPGLNTLNLASPNCFAFLTHPQILSILSS